MDEVHLDGAIDGSAHRRESSGFAGHYQPGGEACDARALESSTNRMRVLAWAAGMGPDRSAVAADTRSPSAFAMRSISAAWTASMESK